MDGDVPAGEVGPALAGDTSGQKCGGSAAVRRGGRGGSELVDQVPHGLGQFRMPAQQLAEPLLPVGRQGLLRRDVPGLPAPRSTGF
ncbi:hypothetical protein OG851_37250 [Streptomyces sp. NBC_00161]|uniref:hypothetical protein n=1 Tax=Streptomyces sp. NBC_00161 TaxID=2975671 RepID=UPI003245A07C